MRAQAIDGFHQIGALRMAHSPEDGATDAFGRFFGAPNLFAATSAIFPTAGQANSTLPMVALTLRQADHIAEMLATGFCGMNHALSPLGFGCAHVTMGKIGRRESLRAMASAIEYGITHFDIADPTGSVRPSTSRRVRLPTVAAMLPYH